MKFTKLQVWVCGLLGPYLGLLLWKYRNEGSIDPLHGILEMISGVIFVALIILIAKGWTAIFKRNSAEKPGITLVILIAKRVKKAWTAFSKAWTAFSIRCVYGRPDANAGRK
jgi:hypothetical protein